MTKPKRHIVGQVAHLTRRTTHRTYFLTPGQQVRNLVGYMYGKAANDHLQEPCVACCLTNHFTATQFDPFALRSRFLQQFHSGTALKRNRQLKRREALWATACSPGDMVCLDLDAIIEKVLYTCLQPVAAHLVDRCEEWTGFMILPRHWGKPMRFPRPAECGPSMPEFIEFTPQPPPGFRDQPLDEVIAFFEHLIEREEARHRRNRKGPVRGIAWCEAVNPFSCPKTPAPMGTLNPRFTGSTQATIIAAIERERRFQQEHRAAFETFREGNRDILFPSGTIQMPLRCGCHTLPTPRGDPHESRLGWTHQLRIRWASFHRR